MIGIGDVFKKVLREEILKYVKAALKETFSAYTHDNFTEPEWNEIADFFIRELVKKK